MIFDLGHYGNVEVCEIEELYFLVLNEERLPIYSKDKREMVSHCLILQFALKKLEEKE